MPVLLAHQAVTHPATLVGSAVNVGSADEVYLDLFHGFNEAAANTNPGSFLIQTSASGSGDEDWITRAPFTVVDGTPADEAFTATEPADETTIAVALTGGFAAGDLVYIRDTVLADSEWAYVQEIVTDTSITLVDGLARAHALTTTSLFGSAERFSARVNVKGGRRLRAVYQHEGATGANVHLKANYELIRFS